MILEDNESHPGEGFIFPESIEDRGVGGKTWIGVGRGVGGTPSCINTICFFWGGGGTLIYQYNMFFFGAPFLYINTTCFLRVEGCPPSCINIILHCFSYICKTN